MPLIPSLRIKGEVTEMEKELLKIKNLHVHFFLDEGEVPAVDGLNLTLHENETLAIVGESGCGKSVTSLSVLRIVPSPPGKVLDGEIIYKGRDLLKLSEREMQSIRGNEISMIFQEPLTSLNPVFSIGHQIMESLRRHQGMSKEQAEAKAIEMLGLVGIHSPDKMIKNYPHQLSGGMRQRAMIAMALACNPTILIADEPTTALDVTIQAQILRLLSEIKRNLNTSIILITHDLGIVAQIAQRVMVMYAGQAVEYADVNSIFKEPLHPYTMGLLKSIPVIGDERDELYNIKGMLPTPKDYPRGCRFAPRCECAMERCMNDFPPMFEHRDGRKVRCWKYEKRGEKNA